MPEAKNIRTVQKWFKSKNGPDESRFPKSRTKDEDENDYDKEQNDKGGRQRGRGCLGLANP